jgi:DNA primase small subunit
MELGFTRGATSQILNERERIRNEWSRQMLWSAFQDKWRINETIWKNIVEKAMSLVALPAKIDTVVTTDLHRLIRMPGTLNGKTGLKATSVALEELESFDPFSESIVFDGTQKIHVGDTPEVRIKDRRFGPFVDETVEVPLAVAVLLIAKGVATPVK